MAQTEQTPETDAAVIAAKLTEAQIHVVKSSAAHHGYMRAANALSLPLCGMVERSAAQYWRLTPLGLAVRTHLIGEQP